VDVNNNKDTNHSNDNESDKSSNNCNMVTVKIKTERLTPEPFELTESDSSHSKIRKRSNRETSEKGNEDNMENSPKAPRSLSPVRDIATFQTSLELLQRIFPQQSRAMLELILRSSEEDVVKAIESLLPETNPRILSGPLGIRSVPTQQPNLPYGPASSAFSPIAKNHVFFKPGTYSPHAPYPPLSPRSPTAHIPSAFQIAEGCSPELSPSIKERFCFPVGGYLPYKRPASAALLSMTSQQGSVTNKFCVNCGFNLKPGDKFCSDCGKSL